MAIDCCRFPLIVITLDRLFVHKRKTSFEPLTLHFHFLFYWSDDLFVSKPKAIELDMFAYI